MARVLLVIEDAETGIPNQAGLKLTVVATEEALRENPLSLQVARGLRDRFVRKVQDLGGTALCLDDLQSEEDEG